MTPKNQQQVVQEAMTWLGTPYHHQADVKGAGVDCAMILVRVYRAVGLIPEFDPRPYPHDWHLHQEGEKYLGFILQHADLVVGDPEPGDIAMFKFGRASAHGAIVIDWPLVLHATQLSGAVILADISTSEDYTNRLRGFYRLRG